MSDSYGIYAVSDDDQPVIDALALAFPDAEPVDDGTTVDFAVPGRAATLWRDDIEGREEFSDRPVREILVWGGGDTMLRVTLEVIDVLRSQGIEVILYEEHPDLIAADAERTPAAS